MSDCLELSTQGLVTSTDGFSECCCSARFLIRFLFLMFNGFGNLFIARVRLLLSMRVLRLLFIDRSELNPVGSWDSSAPLTGGFDHVGDRRLVGWSLGSFKACSF